MTALAEVTTVVQRPGEPPQRWFASESLDLLVWLDAAGAPTGFQLSWRDGGQGHALTARDGGELRHEQVDESRRDGGGHARSATLHAAVEEYDLALIQPRFAALSRALPAALRDYVLHALGVSATEAAPLQTRWLEGLVVLVTRPLRQAKKLVTALDAVGAEARLLPMIAIRPAPDAALAAGQLLDHRQAAAWLFTSANAVAAANNLIAAKHWHAPVFAVGEATAKALKTLGHHAQRPPPEAIHSEGLLSLPALHDVAGQSVLIVTGEGGRDGLREPLLARGARVEVATVYRREVVPHLPETVQATLEDVDALLLTSGESLVALHRALPAAHKMRVLQLPLVVPSQRVQAMARTLGFSQPLLAATVSDEAFVQALVDWRRPRAA